MGKEKSFNFNIKNPSPDIITFEKSNTYSSLTRYATPFHSRRQLHEVSNISRRKNVCNLKTQEISNDLKQKISGVMNTLFHPYGRDPNGTVHICIVQHFFWGGVGGWVVVLIST